jgi:hypothetical protein
VTFPLKSSIAQVENSGQVLTRYQRPPIIRSSSRHSIGDRVALLDGERTARHHAGDMLSYVWWHSPSFGTSTGGRRPFGRIGRYRAELLATHLVREK